MIIIKPCQVLVLFIKWLLQAMWVEELYHVQHTQLKVTYLIIFFKVLNCFTQYGILKFSTIFKVFIGDLLCVVPQTFPSVANELF